MTVARHGHADGRRQPGPEAADHCRAAGVMNRRRSRKPPARLPRVRRGRTGRSTGRGRRGKGSAKPMRQALEQRAAFASSRLTTAEISARKGLLVHTARRRQEGRRHHLPAEGETPTVNGSACRRRGRKRFMPSGGAGNAIRPQPATGVKRVKRGERQSLRWSPA